MLVSWASRSSSPASTLSSLAARRSTSTVSESAGPSTVTGPSRRPSPVRTSEALSTTRPGVLTTSPRMASPAPNRLATSRTESSGSSVTMPPATRRSTLMVARESTARRPATPVSFVVRRSAIPSRR